MQQVNKSIGNLSVGEWVLIRSRNQYVAVYYNNYRFYEVFNNLAIGASVDLDSDRKEIKTNLNYVSLICKIDTGFKTIKFTHSKIYSTPDLIFGDLPRPIYITTDDTAFIEKKYLPFPSIINTQEDLRNLYDRNGICHGIITLKEDNKKDEVVGVLKKVKDSLCFFHNNKEYDNPYIEDDVAGYSYKFRVDDEKWWANFQPSHKVDSSHRADVTVKTIHPEAKIGTVDYGVNIHKALEKELTDELKRDAREAMKVTPKDFADYLLQAPRGLWQYGTGSPSKEDLKDIENAFKNSKESDFQNPVIIKTKQTKNKLL